MKTNDTHAINSLIAKHGINGVLRLIADHVELEAIVGRCSARDATVECVRKIRHCADEIEEVA
jgi:hypothetical protein